MRYPHLESPKVRDGREVEAVVPEESHQIRRAQHRIGPVREGPVGYEVYSGEDGQVILPCTFVCESKPVNIKYPKREKGGAT